MTFPRLLPEWMAGHSEPTEVVANDQGAMRSVGHAVLALAGEEGLVVPVQEAGHGWYRMRAELAPTVIGDVEQLLVDARVGALVGLGGGAEVVLLSLIHAGEASGVLVITPGAFPPPPGYEPAAHHADTVEKLGSWLQAVGLPAGRRRVTAERLITEMQGRKGSEALLGMLERLGLKVTDPERWWEELGGATWHFGASEPGVVGTRKVHWRSQRWAAAQGEDFYGIWDRERPERPVQTWPKTPEGREAAERRLHELVVWPILRSTELPGERVWCQVHVSKYAEVELPVIQGALAHRAPTGAAALIWATDPPSTVLVIPAGRSVIPVGRWSTEMAGLLDPDLNVNPHGFILFPNRDLHDVQMAFTAELAGRQLTDWEPVPETVPRTLLETIAYIREQTDLRKNLS